MAFGAAVLLGWTLLGGLDALNAALRDAVAAALRRHGLPARAARRVRRRSAACSTCRSSWYRTFRIEQRFGFNRMTWRLWLADALKGVLRRRAASALPLAALVLWIMGAAGALWWLWAWGAWIGVQPADRWCSYPTVIAPLFNKFEPLDDESLEGARAGADAALRLRREGPVRDGRQPPLGARQRLLHRASAPPSAWSSSTRCSPS